MYFTIFQFNFFSSRTYHSVMSFRIQYTDNVHWLAESFLRKRTLHYPQPYSKSNDALIATIIQSILELGCFKLVWMFAFYFQILTKFRHPTHPPSLSPPREKEHIALKVPALNRLHRATNLNTSVSFQLPRYLVKNQNGDFRLPYGSL